MAKKRTAKPSHKPAKKQTRKPARAKAKKAKKRPSRTARKTSSRGTTGPRTPQPRSAARGVARALATATVVVEMSNNGPHDIRAITVDQFQVFENQSTTEARTEFDITPHFNPPTRIGWEIFAGMQFPRAGVFLERTGRPTQTLGQQAPLKKGEPWLDEKAVDG